MDELMIDRLQIREVIEKWVLYSDSGDFERFPSVWHPDGYMSATWFKGTAKEFGPRAGASTGPQLQLSTTERSPDWSDAISGPIM